MGYSQSEGASKEVGAGGRAGSEVAGEPADGGADRSVRPCHHHELVWISIGQEQFQVRRGTLSVAELKRIASVPECDELAEVKDGRIHVIPDGGSTHIKGGEKFLSSPRSCPSS